MTQTTLRAVTLETVANYRQAAEHAVGAYRASGHRLLAVMSRGVDRAATRGTERIAPRMADALRQTSDKVTGAAAQGIDSVSAQTKRVIRVGSARVSAQVSRVAKLVEGIENRYVATGLQAAARISLTGAQAALTLSEKLVSGADKLAAVVGGSTPARTKRVAAQRGRTVRNAVQRRASPARADVKPQVKAVTKRLKKVAAKVDAVKPVVKATRARRTAAPAA